ncbi:vesicle transport protein SFT2A isoform X2 [Microtus ochrogaster]|uniref:Vesicle transport protein SFT2A isoform X2 n=1 Tax=Microtus ochrogaster TaxID=79684 RepID=A0ABM1AT63_MICOH|nr:vesicle transport protein SFT2A isoform X2 [Microtus ochrogaster]XP_026643235.1 vesicle transport protein SFT2A isoform X2 [Microtus ochrogaster]
MLCGWHCLFNPRNWFAVASQWHKTLCRVLHAWKPCRTGQYVLPDGSREAAEENVRDNKIACYSYHASVLRVHPVCCAVVAEEGAGLTLLHTAVPVDDLVQPVLHPVRKGRCAQVLLLTLQLNGRSALTCAFTAITPETVAASAPVCAGALHL